MRDLLRAQVLLDRHRVVGAALHRRVVGDDHAFLPVDAADAGDHARPPAPRRRTCRSAASWPISRNGVPGSSRPSTRSRGSSLPRATWRSRDLASPPRAISAALRAQVVDLRLQERRVGLELVRARVDARLQRGHGLQLCRCGPDPELNVAAARPPPTRRRTAACPDLPSLFVRAPRTRQVACVRGPSLPGRASCRKPEEPR